jgi:hypothetical protein
VEWGTGRIQEFQDFEGKTSLNTTTGEITIRQLTKQLSGVYDWWKNTDLSAESEIRCKVIVS